MANLVSSYYEGERNLQYFTPQYEKEAYKVSKYENVHRNLPFICNFNTLS